MLAYGGRGLYDTNSDNEAESKGASEDVLTGGSDLASWRSIKARNVVRTELQRDLQKNQLEQLALEFGVDLGAPDVPAVDVVHGKGKVVVLTTNEGKLGVLMQRVFKCAREHDLERALLMIDIASEDCGAWDMVRVVRQHRRVEVRDTFIAVIVDDEDDIRRMPRDILTAHTPSLRSLSQMLGRAAHSIEKESEIAPRKAAVKVPAGNDLVFYRTQSGLVGYVHQNQHKPNIAPPARVFMGLEGNSDSVLDFRPDFLIDSASEPNPPEAAKPSSGGSTPTKGDHHEEDSGGRGFARFKKVAIAAKLTSEFMRGSVTVRSAHGAKATAKRLKDRAAAGALARAASPPKPTLHRQGTSSALAPSGGIVAHQPHGSAAHGHPSSMGASFRAHTRPERGASKAEEAERAREAAREREIEVKLAMPHADISRHESLQSVLRDRERRHASSAYKDASGVTEYLAQCEAMQLEPQMAFITQVNNGGISLRHFPLGFRGGKAVAMALQRNSSVAYVDFAGCDMGADAVTALAGAVTTSGSYKSIDLTLNKSGEKGGEAICKVMRDKSVAPNIRRLLLRGNQIGDKAAKQLAQALLCLHAPSGEVHKGWYLDLRENHISADAALAIAKSIESQRGTSTGVQHLDLSDNQVMDQGVKGLAAALLTNDVLKTLRLANNQLTNETAKYFAETLEYNLRLETLDLSRNDIKGMGGVHLARALPDIRRLTRLNMAQNPLSAKAIVDLVKGATSQPGRTLRILDLSDSWNPNSAMSAGKSLGDKLFANIIELKEFRTFVSRALEGLSPSLVLMDEEVQEAINVCSRICTHPAFTSLLRDSLVLELSSVTVGDVTKKASVEMMIVFDEVTKLEQVWAMELEHDSDAERPQAEVILNLAAPLAPTPRARGNSDPDDLQLQAGQYSLNLGNPWERCVAVRLFEPLAALLSGGGVVALLMTHHTSALIHSLAE
ncbi:hypothetical protein T484DRAFT_1806931 [Baffinella frigidus]|nr:hypothetical protein T484DRAFT_1806931 [Cryptophyta sp. CCMP2293]